MNLYYILEGHTPVLCDSTTWATWFEKAKEERIVARTKTPNGTVSTVFLGLDHAYGSNGPPMIFETLVMDGPLEDEMDRYSTWEEAEAGHASMVERVNSQETTS